MRGAGTSSPSPPNGFPCHSRWQGSGWFDTFCVEFLVPTLLLIDDEESVRYSFRCIYSEEGVEVLTAATALPGGIAMVASFAGMFIGQAVRSRMHPEEFRRWFPSIR